MAIGDSYATLPALKSRYDIADTLDDDRLTAALAAASREIEAHCGRQFNDAGATSARRYMPAPGCLALVDDFHTDAETVEVSTDGLTWSPWTAETDYVLTPLDGVVEGQPGWPYWRIIAHRGRRFTCDSRPTLRVTARWGWPAVPAPVAEACLLIASESFKMADAPFGVAGFGEFGPVRVRMNSRAASLLAPYRRDVLQVG